MMHGWMIHPRGTYIDVDFLPFYKGWFVVFFFVFFLILEKKILISNIRHSTYGAVIM